MSRAPLLLALLLLPACALAGCRTETSVSPVAPAPGLITHARPAQAWRVVEGETLLGWVVRFEDPFDAQRSFFSVRDPHHHDLGLIDLQGRAFRFHAHEREAEWLGTGTVREGARGILGAGPAAELVEEPLAASESAPPAD